MRTTVQLDEQLLAEAKKVAAERGRTLTAVLEDALREAFARRRAQAGQNRYASSR
jgi:predicted transcriptional regulator